MKTVLFSIVFYLPCALFSQEYLGQTKSYIIAHHQESNIVMNEESLLATQNCIDNDCLSQLFWFNPKNDNLCDYWGVEFWEGGKDSIVQQIVGAEKVFMKGDLQFAGLVEKGIRPPDYVPGVAYKKGNKIYIIYDCDITGKFNQGKFTVFIRKYNSQ